MRCKNTNVRDGMKPRYRILHRSLGSVFMLQAVWCDSETRALATEAVLIKLESPKCNIVDRVGSGGWEQWASQIQILVDKNLESPICPETLYTGGWSLVGIEIPRCSGSCVAFQAPVRVGSHQSV